MTPLPDPVARPPEVEQPNLLAAGPGVLRCCACGYEICPRAVLPPCPMCRELEWERALRHRFEMPRATLDSGPADYAAATT
jgi:hypothetical protein